MKTVALVYSWGLESVTKLCRPPLNPTADATSMYCRVRLRHDWKFINRYCNFKGLHGRPISSNTQLFIRYDQHNAATWSLVCDCVMIALNVNLRIKWCWLYWSSSNDGRQFCMAIWFDSQTRGYRSYIAQQLPAGLSTFNRDRAPQGILSNLG